METKDPIDDVKITVEEVDSSGTNLVSDKTGKNKSSPEKLGLVIGAIIFPIFAISSMFYLYIPLDIVFIWGVGGVFAVILTINASTRGFGRGLLLGLLGAPLIFFGLCLGMFIVGCSGGGVHSIC